MKCEPSQALEDINLNALEKFMDNYKLFALEKQLTALVEKINLLEKT